MSHNEQEDDGGWNVHTFREIIIIALRRDKLGKGVNKLSSAEIDSKLSLTAPGPLVIA